MGYSFRTPNGNVVPFKCNLGDKVRAITDDGETIEGIVEGLDDDGYVFISHDGEETRVYNDDIEFDPNDIKGLTFVSENEGYIPMSVVEEYLDN